MFPKFLLSLQLLFGKFGNIKKGNVNVHISVLASIPMKILIKDETPGGETQNSFPIEIKQEYLTVKELIKIRIFEEVKRYNEKLPEYFSSLVQPTNSEVTLNGYKMIEKKKVDPEVQFYHALDAFMKNGFFLILNNVQISSLEEKIKIQDNMELNFVKLTPLVGG